MGVYIWYRGKSNVVYYPWSGNWMYLMQRATGLIAFAYIIQHVWRQRFAGVSLPEHPGAAFHKVQMELSHPVDAGDLCHSDGGDLLAFCLWHLVVCGEMGHYAGRSFATCFRLRMYGDWRRTGARSGLASMYAFISPQYKKCAC